jgi:Domain of unknown function (DUF397)
MDLTRADWRKSTYSGNGGNTCVEVAAAGPVVAVRDSTDPDRAALTFAPDRWSAFTRRVRSGQAELA